MNGPTRRMAATVFVLFGALFVALTWYQVLGADSYRSDPRNTRTVISRFGKERGVIISSDGTVLAISNPDPEDPQIFQRSYPAGPEFTHVVGYTSRLVGDAGLEAAYSDALRSRRDLTISDLISALLGRDLRPLSIETTVDADLQTTAYAALDGQRGSVVAIDPRSGAILAMTSSPSFDAGPFVGPDAVQARQKLLDDPTTPLIDRSTQLLAAPASTFKTVVAASALETGTASPESEFDDVAAYQLPGSTATVENFGGGLCADGTIVTLQTAFIRSCNTVFATLAVQLGAERIGAIADQLGFNRDIDFPWEVARSTFPTRELTEDPAALAQSGLGQRDVRATPLEMAMVAAAIANDGELMQPHLVSQVFDADGATVTPTEVRTLNRAVSPATATVLGQMMERVVTEGTGRRATVPGFRVAGKTGTAEHAGGAPDAWFIGYAPVDDPTIAIAVFVEAGGDAGESATGSTVAAPIAAQVLSRWLGVER